MCDPKVQKRRWPNFESGGAARCHHRMLFSLRAERGRSISGGGGCSTSGWVAAPGSGRPVAPPLRRRPQTAAHRRHHLVRRRRQSGCRALPLLSSAISCLTRSPPPGKFCALLRSIRPGGTGAPAPPPSRPQRPPRPTSPPPAPLVTGGGAARRRSRPRSPPPFWPSERKKKRVTAGSHPLPHVLHADTGASDFGGAPLGPCFLLPYISLLDF